MAGKPIGKVAMTKTERQRKWRAKVRRQKIWGSNRDPNARRPTPRRNDLDFWPTPPCLTAALIQVVLPLLPPGPVWEFAAGDGALADALIAAGRQVFASDVERQRPEFLRHDFLNDPPPPVTHGMVGVTNPPFAGSNLGDPFLRRTLELLDTGHLSAAVLLQRADASGTDGRADIFNRATWEIICCCRPLWIPGTKGGGRWWSQWFVWLAGQSGPPISRRIRRGDLHEAIF
jgi:hypothetical protein